VAGYGQGTVRLVEEWWVGEGVKLGVKSQYDISRVTHATVSRPVRRGVSKGEEDGRRLPALRAGHPPNGRKAVWWGGGGGSPAGRIRVRHGGPA
jgi:hypothetical protein